MTEISGVKLGQLVDRAMREEGFSFPTDKKSWRKCYNYMMRRVRMMTMVRDASPEMKPRYGLERAMEVIPSLCCDFIDKEGQNDAQKT